MSFTMALLANTTISKRKVAWSTHILWTFDSQFDSFAHRFNLDTQSVDCCPLKGFPGVLAGQGSWTNEFSRGQPLLGDYLCFHTSQRGVGKSLFWITCCFCVCPSGTWSRKHRFDYPFRQLLSPRRFRRFSQYLFSKSSSTFPWPYVHLHCIPIDCLTCQKWTQLMARFFPCCVSRECCRDEYS